MFVHPCGDTLNCVDNIDPKCIQPNAIDIRVSKFFMVEDLEHPYSNYRDQLVTISDEGTTHKEISPEMPTDSEGWWILHRGIYQFEAQQYVTIPDSYCGWLITRSTFNRNGIFIMSGLYDSGFHGYVGGTLYNIAGRIKIKRGTRICQLLTAQAEMVHKYSGQYNHKK